MAKTTGWAPCGVRLTGHAPLGSGHSQRKPNPLELVRGEAQTAFFRARGVSSREVEAPLNGA